MYESLMTVLKILYTMTGGPLNIEDLGISLSSLWVNPTLIMWFPRGLFSWKHRHITTVNMF